MLTRNRKRSLPDWMGLSSESRDKITRTTLDGRSQSVESFEVCQEVTNQVASKSNKEKVVKKPLQPIEYNGEIHFFIESGDINAACDDLLQFVNAQTDAEVVPVGFDMEWPFNFISGPQKTALIQICATLDKCYLFHVTKLQILPPTFMEFLKHPKIRWHGVNIKNDFRKLQRDFPAVNSQALIDQCVDLGVYCNKVCKTSGRWSMERLVAFICRMKIDKNSEVRNSKWNVLPLNHFQKLYAAIDVYISQVIYYELENRRLKEEAEDRELAEQASAAEEKVIVEQKVVAEPIEEAPKAATLKTSDDELLDTIQQMIDATSGLIGSTDY